MVDTADDPQPSVLRLRDARQDGARVDTRRRHRLGTNRPRRQKVVTNGKNASPRHVVCDHLRGNSAAKPWSHVLADVGWEVELEDSCRLEHFH